MRKEPCFKYRCFKRERPVLIGSLLYHVCISFVLLSCMLLVDGCMGTGILRRISTGYLM